MEVLLKSSLDLPFVHRGKVRDTYEIENDLLIISTDRISAFDSVFAEGIPKKGEVLSRISAFWFKRTGHIIENHFITDRMPPNLATLQGRAMIVKRATVIPIEAVVRGYLTGSGWKEYKENGTVSGIKLPPGLKNGSRLPSPMFTPTTKAEQGHDLSITLDEARKMFGEKEIAYIGEKAIMLYQFAHDYLLEKGMVLADTKFEFGKIGDKIILIDEMVTPDSSRYWLKKEYDEGVLASMDKQFLRDYLEKSGWDKEPPAPKLPEEIVKKTSERYTDAYEMVTGEKI